MTVKKKAVAMYHVVYEHEGFEDAKKALLSILWRSEQVSPSAPRLLYLDIDHRRNMVGELNLEMWMLDRWMRDDILPFVTEMMTPGGEQVRNPGVQRNDVPHEGKGGPSVSLPADVAKHVIKAGLGEPTRTPTEVAAAILETGTPTIEESLKAFGEWFASALESSMRAQGLTEDLAWSKAKDDVLFLASVEGEAGSSHRAVACILVAMQALSPEQLGLQLKLRGDPFHIEAPVAEIAIPESAKLFTASALADELDPEGMIEAIRWNTQRYPSVLDDQRNG